MEGYYGHTDCNRANKNQVPSSHAGVMLKNAMKNAHWPNYTPCMLGKFASFILVSEDFCSENIVLLQLQHSLLTK